MIQPVALLLFFAAAASTPVLPPTIPWNGASRALVVPANDPLANQWITPSEAGGLKTTPNYDETVAWLRKLVAAAPQLRMVSLGKSHEGRDIWMIIASKERAFTPEAMRGTNKPIVFAQGGIHAGEIDGKDAGMMLLRDMTVRGTKRELLDRANFLFVPIFNVDGHERTSAYSRINQRGPEISGWRTNAQNLNLNRDYMKADSAEMRAMLRALREWEPDLYIDLHVTDGADYQYDITWGANGKGGHSPAINDWIERAYNPAVTTALRTMGHIPGPLVFGVAGDDLTKGIALRPADPRLSFGYGDARHLPTVIVENHSLKPYDQRVLGTYVLLEHTLRVAANEFAELRRAIAADRARNASQVALTWKLPPSGPETIEFLGVESRTSLSPITGNLKTEWLGRPVTMRIPLHRASEVATSVTRPAAYWIPASWTSVLEILDLHAIRYERIAAPRDLDVEMLRLRDPKFAAEQFEGHVRVSATPVAERRRERFPAGSVRVPTNQPNGTLAVLLLEPSSPDSLFQWGFFNSILAATEYVESYVMEPMAERMLSEDAGLAKEFREKVASDPAFTGDARLQWLYERTPFHDERARLYPIGRE